MRGRRILCGGIVLAASLAVSVSIGAQQKKSSLPSAPAAEWPMFNRDLAATRYSPLAQINTKNVGRLSPAWSFKLGRYRDAGGITGGAEVTPIVVKGVMYATTSRNVVALQPETGMQLWSYQPASGTPSKRGVSWWPGDANNPPRILVSTGRKMIALNAKTGKLDPGFGNEGEVDLVVPYDSPPVVYKDTLIVGANTGEAPATGLPGDTRAYDARTGAKKWEFHSVPQPGETGHETWEGDSWNDRSGVNDWGFSMAVDTERGMVYTVFGGPNTNYWGGDRKGDDLFGNSVVALDAETGKMKWYYQVVHHDLWDYDLPPSPVLLDVKVKGKTVPVLAQGTKSGYLYILDRVTGKPVFGVEEKSVPRSQVPGEQSSPTQPIPVKPPALARVSYKADDIVTAADTNEEHAKFCQDLEAKSGGFDNQGPFTPYVFHEKDAPPHSTILFPGSIGGVNWGGVAADPKLGYVFVNSQDEASIGWIERKTGGAVQFDRNSIVGPTSRFQWSEASGRSGNILHSGEHAWPCQKPPWGRLTAINASTGDIAWQITLGVTDELPEGKRNTGRLNMGGPMVTAGGLVFIAATNDKRFRAFDSRTGKQLWETKLEMSAHAIPITYQGKDGKQYVAVVAAGESALDDPAPPGSEALVVFALP
jgi:quinoprotein glucose dehydrogenase